MDRRPARHARHARPSRRRAVAAGVLLVAVASVIGALPAAGAARGATRGHWSVVQRVVDQWSPGGWIGTWRTAMAQSGGAFDDQTLRMIVHPSTGGRMVRIRLTNAAPGVTSAVRIGDARVARRRTGAATSAPQVVRFRGSRSVEIPAGRSVVSDPVSLPFSYGDDLAVSLYVRGRTGRVPEHALSLATNYSTAAGRGDRTGDTSGRSFRPSSPRAWYLLSGVDVDARGSRGDVVALGDSLTDGRGSPRDANERWPDQLARRLNQAGLRVGVLNAGIGGNTLTSCDARFPSRGAPALARFRQDVLDQPGVRAVIVTEGGNDLRYCPDATGRTVAAGLVELAREAHRAGVCMIVGTYPPHVSPLYRYDGAPGRLDVYRQRVNRWILDHRNAFDGVVDFDAAVRNPAHPSTLAPWADHGDDIHPNTAGYRAMAGAVPLNSLCLR